MVSKITIFEPHFDGAQFGPASIKTPTDHDGNSIGHESHDEPESTEESESKSRFTKLLQGTIVFVLLFVGLWVVLSRVLQAEEEDDE